MLFFQGQLYGADWSLCKLPAPTWHPVGARRVLHRSNNKARQGFTAV
jgi:hypothetical protein